MNSLDIENKIQNSNNENYVVEYQVESERGFQLLGATIYTSNTLFPLDPCHFTSLNGEPLGNELTDFEVPDDSWVWAWSQWYVDMTADVDDQGWCYSWRFRSHHWSGRHRFMRSFVRQRIWKRPRIKKNLLLTGFPEEEPKKPTQKEEEEDKTEAILNQINSYRNDREKVNGIINYISTHPEDVPLLVNIRDQVLQSLTFPVSKRSLVKKLSESDNQSCQLFILAPSNAWRDQVLRRGQPDWEIESDEHSVSEAELNAL